MSSDILMLSPLSVRGYCQSVASAKPGAKMTQVNTYNGNYGP